MLYLTNTEENELKRLKTTTDEGVLGDEELWTAKGTRSFSTGFLGGGKFVEFKLKFEEFLRYNLFISKLTPSFLSNSWTV
jgi:hypothetical protein